MRSERMTARFCPRCNKPATRFLVTHEFEMEYCVTADGLIESEGILIDGDPIRVCGVCESCGNAWTVHGARTVGDLRKFRGETDA
jgi:hypothetical protein